MRVGTKKRKDKNRKKRTIRERQRDQYVLQLVDSWWGWLVRERISEAYRQSHPDGDYMDLPPEGRWAAFLAMAESDRERATEALRDAKRRGLDPSDDICEDNEISIRVSDDNARKVYHFHPDVYYAPLSVPLDPDTPDHYSCPSSSSCPTQTPSSSAPTLARCTHGSTYPSRTPSTRSEGPLTERTRRALS